MIAQIVVDGWMMKPSNSGRPTDALSNYAETLHHEGL